MEGNGGGRIEDLPGSTAAAAARPPNDALAESGGTAMAGVLNPRPSEDASRALLQPERERAHTDWRGFSLLAETLRIRASRTRTWSAVALAATLLLVLLGVGTIVVLPEYLKYRHISSLLERADELGKTRVERANREYRLELAEDELSKLSQAPSSVKLAELILEHIEAKKTFDTEKTRIERQCTEQITKVIRDKHPEVRIDAAPNHLTLMADDQGRTMLLPCEISDSVAPDSESPEPSPMDAFADEAAVDAPAVNSDSAGTLRGQGGPLDIALQTADAVLREFRRNPTKFGYPSGEPDVVLDPVRKAYVESRQRMKAQLQAAKAAGGAEYVELERVLEDADDEETAAAIWAQNALKKHESYVARANDVVKLEAELKGLKDVEEKLNTAVVEQRRQATIGTEFSYDALANRVTAALLFVFLVQVLVAVHRYSHRLAAFYDARADMLSVAGTSQMPFEGMRHIESFLSTDHLAFKDTPRSPMDALSKMVGKSGTPKKPPSGSTA